MKQKTKLRGHIIRSATGALLLSSAIIALTSIASVGGSGGADKILPGHMPEAVKLLQPVGRLPASNHLHLAISLQLPNEDALNNFLERLYDPASPNYHHYLTPKQFTEMFGPTEADYQAVINFAER